MIIRIVIHVVVYQFDLKKNNNKSSNISKCSELFQTNRPNTTLPESIEEVKNSLLAKIYRLDI